MDRKRGRSKSRRKTMNGYKPRPLDSNPKPILKDPRTRPQREKSVGWDLSSQETTITTTLQNYGKQDEKKHKENYERNCEEMKPF